VQSNWTPFAERCSILSQEILVVGFDPTFQFIHQLVGECLLTTTPLGRRQMNIVNNIDKRRGTRYQTLVIDASMLWISCSPFVSFTTKSFPKSQKTWLIKNKIKWYNFRSIGLLFNLIISIQTFSRHLVFCCKPGPSVRILHADWSFALHFCPPFHCYILFQLIRLHSYKVSINALLKPTGVKRSRTTAEHEIYIKQWNN